jgi:hypothetical protein
MFCGIYLRQIVDYCNHDKSEIDAVNFEMWKCTYIMEQN